jgi:allantoicase
MNYLDLPNLASPQLGTKILFATDEWFAAAGSCEDFFLYFC